MSFPRSLRSRPALRDSENSVTIQLMVGLSGLEPPTSRLSGVRSNRLSYKPISWFERWFPTRPLVFPASAFVRALCVFQHSVAFSIAVRRTGGDERVRTDDPLLAKQVLSQLSYTPIFTCGRIPIHFLRIPFQGPSKLNNDSKVRSVSDLGCWKKTLAFFESP